MKGTPHEVFAEDGKVGMGNVLDEAYSLWFESWDDVRQFIHGLEQAAEKAFGREDAARGSVRWQRQ